MIAVHSDRSRLVHLLECLKNGTDIKVPVGGWTGNDMLALAGAGLAGAYSQQPQAFSIRNLKLKDMPQEHAEFVEEQFRNDLHAAAEFISNLLFAILDGTYEDSYAPSMITGVSQTHEGSTHKVVRPIKGHKEYRDLV